MNKAVIHTPIGFLEIGEDDGFITKIAYLSENEKEILPATDTLKKAVSELGEYFNGQRKEFTFKMKTNGSEYYQKVWDTLFEKVKFSNTISYKDLANLTNNPKAIRAVGSAMRKNPIIIAIPCHRVLPSSGEIGYYSAGGSANKDWLLTFEAQNL